MKVTLKRPGHRDIGTDVTPTTEILEGIEKIEYEDQLLAYCKAAILDCLTTVECWVLQIED